MPRGPKSPPSFSSFSFTMLGNNSLLSRLSDAPRLTQVPQDQDQNQDEGEDDLEDSYVPINNDQDVDMQDPEPHATPPPALLLRMDNPLAPGLGAALDSTVDSDIDSIASTSGRARAAPTIDRAATPLERVQSPARYIQSAAVATTGRVRPVPPAPSRDDIASLDSVIDPSMDERMSNVRSSANAPAVITNTRNTTSSHFTIGTSHAPAAALATNSLTLPISISTIATTRRLAEHQSTPIQKLTCPLSELVLDERAAWEEVLESKRKLGEENINGRGFPVQMQAAPSGGPPHSPATPGLSSSETNFLPSSQLVTPEHSHQGATLPSQSQPDSPISLLQSTSTAALTLAAASMSPSVSVVSGRPCADEEDENSKENNVPKQSGTGARMNATPVDSHLVLGDRPIPISVPFVATNEAIAELNPSTFSSASKDDEARSEPSTLPSSSSHGTEVESSGRPEKSRSEDTPVRANTIPPKAEVPVSHEDHMKAPLTTRRVSQGEIKDESKILSTPITPTDDSTMFLSTRGRSKQHLSNAKEGAVDVSGNTGPTGSGASERRHSPLERIHPRRMLHPLPQRPSVQPSGGMPKPDVDAKASPIKRKLSISTLSPVDTGTAQNKRRRQNRKSLGNDGSQPPTPSSAGPSGFPDGPTTTCKRSRSCAKKSEEEDSKHNASTHAQPSRSAELRPMMIFKEEQTDSEVAVKTEQEDVKLQDVADEVPAKSEVRADEDQDRDSTSANKLQLSQHNSARATVGTVFQPVPAVRSARSSPMNFPTRETTMIDRSAPTSGAVPSGQTDSSSRSNTRLDGAQSDSRFLSSKGRGRNDRSLSRGPGRRPSDQKSRVSDHSPPRGRPPCGDSYMPSLGSSVERMPANFYRTRGGRTPPRRDDQRRSASPRNDRTPPRARTPPSPYHAAAERLPPPRRSPFHDDIGPSLRRTALSERDGDNAMELMYPLSRGVNVLPPAQRYEPNPLRRRRFEDRYEEERQREPGHQGPSAPRVTRHGSTVSPRERERSPSFWERDDPHSLDFGPNGRDLREIDVHRFPDQRGRGASRSPHYSDQRGERNPPASDRVAAQNAAQVRPASFDYRGHRGARTPSPERMSDRRATQPNAFYTPIQRDVERPQDFLRHHDYPGNLDIEHTFPASLAIDQNRHNPHSAEQPRPSETHFTDQARPSSEQHRSTVPIPSSIRLHHHVLEQLQPDRLHYDAYVAPQGNPNYRYVDPADASKDDDDKDNGAPDGVGGDAKNRDIVCNASNTNNTHSRPSAETDRTIRMSTRSPIAQSSARDARRQLAEPPFQGEQEQRLIPSPSLRRPQGQQPSYERQTRDRPSERIVNPSADARGERLRNTRPPQELKDRIGDPPSSQDAPWSDTRRPSRADTSSTAGVKSPNLRPLSDRMSDRLGPAPYESSVIGSGGATSYRPCYPHPEHPNRPSVGGRDTDRSLHHPASPPRMLSRFDEADQLSPRRQSYQRGRGQGRGRGRGRGRASEQADNPKRPTLEDRIEK